MTFSYKGVTRGNYFATASYEVNPLSFNWADLGGWGAFGALASLVLWLVLSGRLVPKSTHREVVEDRNHYRDASDVKDDTIKQLVEQNGELRFVGRVQVATMQAITRTPGEEEGT